MSILSLSSLSLLLSLQALFEPCDWSTRFIVVILRGLPLVRTRVLSDHPRFVQSNSPAGLSVYKCTVAGLNLKEIKKIKLKGVLPTGIMRASSVLTKTTELTQFCSD